MTQKPETRFQEKVKDKIGALKRTWVSKIQQVSIVGSPDLVGVINGYFIALELKASEKHKLSKIQKYNLEQIRKAEGIGIVVYPENWNRVYTFLLKLSLEQRDNVCLPLNLKL